MNKYKTTIKTLAYLSIISLIIFYGYYQTRDIVAGPVLNIDQPLSGEISRSGLVSVSGHAERISKISLNGNQIYTDREGKFEEVLLLGVGYNIIEVKAEDRFDRQVAERLELVYRP
jgi:hypothetical protein